VQLPVARVDGHGLVGAGAFLMGRNSYESMAGFWPNSDHPSAKTMNEIPRSCSPAP
jgi:hypothetical protein